MPLGTEKRNGNDTKLSKDKLMGSSGSLAISSIFFLLSPTNTTITNYSIIQLYLIGLFSLKLFL